jgi:hypothetical protein
MMEVIIPEGTPPLDAALTVRAELIACFRQEAEMAEELAATLRQHLARIEAGTVPQNAAELLADTIGPLQTAKNDVGNYYYKKADPLRMLRLWHDLFLAFAIQNRSEDAAKGMLPNDAFSLGHASGGDPRGALSVSQLQAMSARGVPEQRR